MEDPVIVASGRTYEHAYVREWFEMGITVCPMTRQAFGHTNMIPNHTCGALISNWCEMKNMKLPDPLNLVSIGDPFDVPFPAAGLLDPDGEVKSSVENLKSDSVETQRKATDCEGITLLVDLLHSIDPQIQENSVTTLLYLAIDHDDKIAIANSDAIRPLIHVLQTGKSEAQENLAATLFCLSMIHGNKARIAQENKTRIVQAGGVKPLIDLINPVSGMVDKAIAVLESLSRIPEGRAAISEPGGIRILEEVVELGLARGKENATSILLWLCVNSTRFCRMVLLEGCEPTLVQLALSGTPRAREKGDV